MKMCVCCGAVAPPRAETCAKCGEASWLAFPSTPLSPPKDDGPLFEPVREAPPNVEPPPVESTSGADDETDEPAAETPPTGTRPLSRKERKALRHRPN